MLIKSYFSLQNDKSIKQQNTSDCPLNKPGLYGGLINMGTICSYLIPLNDSHLLRFIWPELQGPLPLQLKAWAHMTECPAVKQLFCILQHFQLWNTLKILRNQVFCIRKIYSFSWSPVWAKNNFSTGKNSHFVLCHILLQVVVVVVAPLRDQQISPHVNSSRGFIWHHLTHHTKSPEMKNCSWKLYKYFFTEAKKGGLSQSLRTLPITC